MAVPDWVYKTVFYQIFPDRFANGNLENDPVNVHPWGSQPQIVGWMGGDFAGIHQKLDYLSDLGINAIYLNPIFLSSSNHRYNTADYFKIDPRLGTRDEFKALISDSHRKGIRILLDGVFNHCGRGFFAFSDVLENGNQSPYKNWFHINRFPLDAYGPGQAKNYVGWWGFKSLPKFNTDEPRVREYILEVARYWIDEGIDGWRLDVPNEIDDDGFWGEFRRVVKRANPEAHLIGEIWDIQSRWVGDGHFDGLMNYPFRTAILNLLTGTEDIHAFAKRVQQVYDAYPLENLHAMYNLLGSHDTERIAMLLNDQQEKIRLAFMMLFSLPGSPAVYYGDEVGLEGGKDPDCRRSFPWDSNPLENELRKWIRKLIKLRVDNNALHTGLFEWVDSTEKLIVFLRKGENNQLLFIFNPSDHAEIFRIEHGVYQLKRLGVEQDLLNQPLKSPISETGSELEIGPWSGLVFEAA